MIINNIITKKGLALPIGNDYYLMKGKNPNKTDDIDIDVKLKNGVAKLSVDNGEVVKKDKNNNEVKVFSAQKFLGGESPANLILKGANPNLVFAAQEQYKQMNGINDDGSKKKAKFGIRKFIKGLFEKNKNDNVQIPVDEKKNDTVILNYKGQQIPIDREKFDNLPDTILSFNNEPNELLEGTDFTKKPMTRTYWENLRYMLFDKNSSLRSIDKTKKTITDLNKDEYYRTSRPRYEYLTRNNTSETIKALKRIQLYDKIKELSDNYEIDPNLVAHRFIKEGAFDKIIDNFNWYRTPKEQKEYDFDEDYKNILYNSYELLGLDTFKELYDNGKINIKNDELNNYIKNVETFDRVNEKGHPIKEFDANIYQSLELYAAFFKYLKDKYPNTDLETLNAMYNRGVNGAKKMNKTELYKKYSVPEYYTNINHNKKQYGGMNKTQYNIQILGYVPSTGKQYKSNNRKKALWGTDGKWYEKEEDMPLNVRRTYYSKAPERLSLPMFTVPKITKQTVTDNKSKNNPKSNKDVSPEEAMRRTGFNYFLSNGVAQGINLLSGLYHNTANAITNKAALNKMEKLVNDIKSYDIPLTSLKTKFNINPQLSEVERKLGLTTRDIDANTASSQVALTRKRNAIYNASIEKNKLYGQKENIETELINKNILQQANTIAKNIQNRQNIDMYKNAALRDLIDKHSESRSSMWQNYAGVFNSVANSIGDMFNTWLKYKAGMNGSPNGIVGANV